MARSFAVFALIAAATLGALILLKAAPQQVAPPITATAERTFLLTLGEKASTDEDWAGSIQSASGAITSITGWHLSGTDRITGQEQWTVRTRRDEVLPFSDPDYTEIGGTEKPAILFHPVGLVVTVAGLQDSRISVQTAQGNFDFSLSSLRIEPTEFLGGRATAREIPSTQRLTTPQYQDDEPSAAALPDGTIVSAWVAYEDMASRVMVRMLRNGTWSQPQEVTPKPADVFRCSVVAGPDGNLWAFWSQRENEQWQIWGREQRAGAWQAPELVAQTGSNTFLRAAASPSGQIAVVWQSYRDAQSDIYLKVRSSQGAWSPEVRLSDSPANEWEPSVAVSSDGAVYAAWDSYARGNYDVQFRAWRNGVLSSIENVTSSPKFQAHTSVAVDRENRAWVAWNEGGVNWGKDQAFLIPTPLSVPLHHERTVRLAMWDGKNWLTPGATLPSWINGNSEHPQIAFDPSGTLYMTFRHSTRQNSRTIGSPTVWENFLTVFDGETWTAPSPIPNSGGSIEKHPALTRDSRGVVYAAWMTDNRPFSRGGGAGRGGEGRGVGGPPVPAPPNADIYFARLTPSQAPAAKPQAKLVPFVDPFAEAIPVHAREAEDIKTIRSYTISSGGKQYKIYRGDMHRHTDMSTDFKYDGSLIEVYRYGIDVAGMDYIAATDHGAGNDQEYPWWQGQQLVDVFKIPGGFTPLFAYERSLNFPNGHRNVVWAKRGFRTLPSSAAERGGGEGAARLYAELKRTDGISMPHSSATNQGTDWRDNDPEVEPLIEIYQGYRTSYEYEGAPRAATTANKRAQKSGFQPQGFWWNALDKGYKLGVQASSDHWSTHVSYACILAESWTREGLLDAMRKRHAYAATDNIVLNFQAVTGNTTALMGDIVPAAANADPRLIVRVVGTGTIKQIDVIRNHGFIYSTRPGTRQASFDYVDRQSPAGESWYYVRVMQDDGQLAWSSPIWIQKPASQTVK